MTNLVTIFVIKDHEIGKQYSLVTKSLWKLFCIVSVLTKIFLRMISYLLLYFPAYPMMFYTQEFDKKKKTYDDR